jgi:hypothetical protein
MAEPNGADHDSRYNRDEDLKPAPGGGPPRPATEPAGSEGSTRTSKTATDPATGESAPPAPRTKPP